MEYPVQSLRKILMTADAIGGIWTYTLDLCRALNDFNIQVCLATMGAPLSAVQRMEAEEIPNLEIRESYFKLEWMDNPWEDVDRAGGWLLELEKEVKPDIIHLNGYSHASLAWNAPVVVVAHSCVLSWWQAVKKERAPLEWNEYKDRVERGLRAAEAVIAISHTYAHELNTLYGPQNKITVIYNGKDRFSFYALDKKYQAFAMGRVWDEAKNLSIFERISHEVSYPILIAGDKYHPNTNVPVEIANVQLLGALNQPDIKRILAESFVYIHPAKYEPFGLAVLEAALSGCVLVLADIPTLRELWQNSALYFNPDRPEELEQLLDKLMQNPEMGKRLIQRSIERAKLFSLESMGRNYLKLYDSLLQKEQPLTETSIKNYL
jgi:glycogen synthase